jgi:hypothetical protein
MRKLAEAAVETSAVVKDKEKEQYNEHGKGGLSAERHVQQSPGLL